MSTSLVDQTPRDIQLYKELVNEVTTPPNLSNLNEMITLIPCAHRVQSSVFKTKEEKTCPKCELPASRCLTQNQVKKILFILSQMSVEFKVKRGLIHALHESTINKMQHS